MGSESKLMMSACAGSVPIARFERMGLASAADFESSAEDVDHFYAGVHVRVKGLMLLGFGAGEELGHTGAEAAFGNEDAKALGDVVGWGCADRDADAVLLALDAEDALSVGVVGVEEVGEVFAEDERDAGKVAEGRNDATGFKLGEEAGGEAGLAAKLDESHGTLETKLLDALSEAGGGQQALGWVWIYGVCGREFLGDQGSG
jgi:hypothetical protein